MEKIKLGAIGCGSHASAAIHPSLVRVPEIDWVAACDLDGEKVNRTASIYAVQPYTDLEEMFRKEELDAVLVIAQPADHFTIGLRVLEAGYHLIVEKPPATSAADAQKLVEAAKKAGKMGAVSTHWRHSPAHRKMKELMEKPEFGKPTFYEGRFHAWGPTAPGEFDSTFMYYLFGQGVHIMDCTRFLMGDISQVFALGHEGEEGAIGMSVSLRFASGAVGQIGMASAAPVMEQYVSVFGDGRQWLRVDNHDRLEFSTVPPWLGEGGYRDVPIQEWRPGSGAYVMAYSIAYIEEHRHFAQALLAGEQPHASLEDGYQALRVLEAINQSLQTGQLVSV